MGNLCRVRTTGAPMFIISLNDNGVPTGKTPRRGEVDKLYKEEVNKDLIIKEKENGNS